MRLNPPSGTEAERTARASVIAVTSEMPWPLDSGGHLRSYHLLKALAARFETRVVTPQFDGVGHVAALQKAGLRACPIEVAPRSFLGESIKVLDATLRGEPYVMFRRHRHRAVRRALEHEFNHRPAAVMYLDHLDSLVYADLRGTAPAVIDMHNVYSRLAGRAAAETQGPLRRRYVTHQARLLEQMERRAVAVAHTVIAVSFDEARYFQELGARRVVVVPNGVDCAAYESVAAAERTGPPTILYVGALAWPPNASAARFLAKQVLPAVRARLPEARLVIVGKDPPSEVRALAAEDVKVAANVPDVIPYYRQAHVLAVPLQAGGGTRLKILEAFAAGVPVVSTALGCEGLEAVHGRHLIVAERADFAAAVTGILTAPIRSQSLGVSARALALAQYDWPIVGAVAAEAVRFAVDDFELANRAKASGHSERNATLSPIGRL